MSNTRSLSEIVNKAAAMRTSKEKIEWLQENNSMALRTVLSIIYDPKTYAWNIPNTTIPPYTPSPHFESAGMLYRQVRKLRYFIKGFDGDNLHQYRREFLFIEMLESIDKEDAKLMEHALMHKPIDGLSRTIIIHALGEIIPREDDTIDSRRAARDAKIAAEKEAAEVAAAVAEVARLESEETMRKEAELEALLIKESDELANKFLAADITPTKPKVKANAKPKNEDAKA